MIIDGMFFFKMERIELWFIIYIFFKYVIFMFSFIKNENKYSYIFIKM